jgi:hypothetical protein
MMTFALVCFLCEPTTKDSNISVWHACWMTLIAAIVAIIVLIRSNDDGTRMEELPLVYDPPTAEVCTSIAKLKGQDDMIV